MRITYYTFPEEVSPADCIGAYLKAKGWAPDMNDREDMVRYRNLKRNIEEYGEIECSISFAKKLLRAIGGTACIQHFDRDGGHPCVPLLERMAARVGGRRYVYRR